MRQSENRMSREDFINNTNIVRDALADYIQQCEQEDTKVISQPPMHDLTNELDLGRYITEGGLRGNSLKQFIETYLKNTTKLRHRKFLSHQISIPHPTGALGALVNGFTNNETSLYEMGPSATSIEFFMVNWMLEKIGWTPSPVPGNERTADLTEFSAGILTHGGSLANMTAILTARSAKNPNIWQEGQPNNLVLLVPEQSHYSLKRTAAILGIGENNCVAMPADHVGRVLPDTIPALISDLEKQGKKVFAIVANACGTAAGLYDPIGKIADICKNHNIWLHVDAAHGAGAILSQKHRHFVAGIEKADSVIWDAHKMFQTPALCAALLVKDYRHLDGTFSQDATYMFHDKNQPGVDMATRTFECTKSAMGLNMFMSIAAMGEKKLIQYIDNCTDLARMAADYINDQPDFECPVIPETNIICYRIKGDDERQLELKKKLLDEGKFYISTTRYQNKWWLRCVFINPGSTLQDFVELIEEIRRINAELKT